MPFGVASRWAIVAIGGLQPVVAPLVVLDAGYQLSIVGVVAMIAAAQLSTRIGANRPDYCNDRADAKGTRPTRNAAMGHDRCHSVTGQKPARP